MRGDLRESSLADVMRHLYAERKSGILYVSRQNIKKRIHLKKGVSIFADAGDGQVQTREQAELLAYSLFTWSSGEFAFEEGEPDIDDSLAFEGSPSSMILEGSRRIDEVEILELLIGSRDTVFTCTKTSVLPLFKMKLSRAENAILTFARERVQFSAADLPLPSGDVAVASALNALVAVGLLKMVKKANAPEPVPVAATPPPPPAPPRPVPTPPPPTVPVAAPAPAAPAVASAPPPPAPEPPPPTSKVLPGAGVLNDMDQLLNTYEAKRSALPAAKPAAPTPPQPARQPPPPPVQAMAPPPQAPVIEADVPPEVTVVDAEPEPEPEPPVVEAAPAPMPEPEPPAPQPPAPPAPNVPPTTAPAPPRPSLSDLLGTWKSAIVERLPQGKTRLIAGGSIALVGIVSILLLTSGSDEASQPDAVVAADSTPSVETAPPRPERPAPKPERVPLPEPEPSEAELFYRAHVAFESGDFEQSKQELLMLLELKPNLAAAHELMSRIERELAPEPEPPKPKPRPRRVVRKPDPEPEPTPEPAPPTPSELFAGAHAALNRDELEDAQAKLDDLKTMNPRYPGAQQLESELSDRFWERKLPLVFSARHDHALGGCNGVLTLTSRGYGYRSDDHEWSWSFGEIGETDRRGARSLHLETTRGKSYKFELRDALSNDDWSRYQQLRSR